MPDVLKRFIPTQVECALELHGTTFTVATNCQVLANRLLDAFARSASEVVSPRTVAWRVVVEPDDHLEVATTFLSGHRWSHGGLALVTIGPKHFLAFDLQAHQGISFISQNLAHNDGPFREYFLPAMLSLLNESIETPL